MSVVTVRCGSSSSLTTADGWVPAQGRDDEALPHHPRRESGLAARRLDFLFQEAMRFPADVARPRIGPGPAFVVGGAGGFAEVVALAAFDLAALELEILVIAAGTVDRGFDRPVPGFDHAGAPDAGDAAIVLHARGHAALEPAHRAAIGVGRVVEAPGPAAPVALAEQRTILGVARWHRRAGVIAARTVEIAGLGPCRARRDGRQTCERNPPRPKQTAYSHTRSLPTY